MGTASINEILCLFNPKYYAIWNDKSRKGIEKLEIEDKIAKKSSITGKEYVEIINILKEILNELNEIDFPAKDLLGVDYFLYLLSIYKENSSIPPDEDIDHDDIRDKIL